MSEKLIIESQKSARAAEAVYSLAVQVSTEAEKAADTAYKAVRLARAAVRAAKRVDLS